MTCCTDGVHPSRRTPPPAARAFRVSSHREQGRESVRPTARASGTDRRAVGRRPLPGAHGGRGRRSRSSLLPLHEPLAGEHDRTAPSARDRARAVSPSPAAGPSRQGRAGVGNAVTMGLSFYPRGGSAQVARYLAAALERQGWPVRLFAGSLGEAGAATNAAAFFDGLDVTSADFTPAWEAFGRGGDPMAAEVPLHPSFEDRPGAPDRLFASLDEHEMRAPGDRLGAAACPRRGRRGRSRAPSSPHASARCARAGGTGAAGDRASPRNRAEDARRDPPPPGAGAFGSAPI